MLTSFTEFSLGTRVLISPETTLPGAGCKTNVLIYNKVTKLAFIINEQPEINQH